MAISKSFITLAISLGIACQLSSCTHVHLSPDNSKSSRHTLLTDSPPQKKPNLPNNNNQSKQFSDLTGKWTIGFQNDNKVLSSTLDLLQKGNNLSGEGVDDQTKRHFRIEDGVLNGTIVTFSKIYDDSDLKIEYKGELSNLSENNYHGPYIGGNYTTNYQGKTAVGPWEAVMLVNQAAPSKSENQVNLPTVSNPELSGKWTVGYEYNFSNFHSTMYLEQEGSKISGHGIDTESKEKFEISHGWYKFPNLTIVRQYKKGKGLAKSNRQMTFKAQVSYVNGPDYQGPYLNGKTEGGGTWEAELIK